MQNGGSFVVSLYKTIDFDLQSFIVISDANYLCFVSGENIRDRG